MEHSYSSDPYRAVRKPASPDGSYESENVYSRSPSESSTTRLSTNNYDPYVEKKKKKKKQPHVDKRANSYLPYTNHRRVETAEPVALQEDHYHRQQIGSILQDNIMMDMMHDYNTPHHEEEDNAYKKELNTTSDSKTAPKSFLKRLGISGKKLLFGIFGSAIVVAIIWYFVWPRDPTLAYLDAGLTSNANYSSTSMIASWNVNFTVDNSANWIPTNINNFAVSVLDSSTGETFGYGNSGHVTLAPRSMGQVITVPININFTRDATSQTIKDLLNACSMLNQDLSSSMPKQTLDITFSVKYYIAGISWHTISTFTPQSYFQCPMALSS